MVSITMCLCSNIAHLLFRRQYHKVLTWIVLSHVAEVTVSCAL